MLQFRKQRLVYQTAEPRWMTQLLIFKLPTRIAPFIEITMVIVAKKFDYGQFVHSEARIGRVPALADHRTGGQISRIEMLEQLAKHLRRQIIDAGW